MKIAVLMKDVPDLVEELELTDEGRLAVEDMSFVPSEWDDQALEEALILKESTAGSSVTAIALDTGDVDNMPFTALAKGADRAVKLVGDLSRALSNQGRAALLAAYCQTQGFDLVMTGVQAIDDIDGQIAGLVAGHLGAAHASVVRDVALGSGQVTCIQEYSGGKMAELSLSTPAVLGVQAAQKPPRYVTVSKIRQIQKSVTLEEVEVTLRAAPELMVRRLYPPVASSHAEMWGDDVDTVADRIVNLLEEHKLLRS